jgi:hypothetical protein
MPVMNRAQFARELEEGLNTVFGLDYKSHPEEWRPLFEVNNSKKAFEEDLLVTGFAAAQVKAEGSSVAFDTAQEAWTARYQHETIALQFALTEEAIEDNLYMQMGTKYAKALSRSMIHTKEIKGAAIFNNAFSTSYNGGDGKPLLATDHPLSGGGTFSNKLATDADFSETALEDILIQIRKAKDDRGIPIALSPKMIVIPPELEYVAARILLSTGRAGTADNDINAINRKGIFASDPHVLTRLTDPDAWFVKTDANDGLKYFDLCRERYSLGWTDPRTLFGSAGA